MATLTAFDQFDMTTTDLNFYFREFYDDLLTKNANLALGGVVYPDYYLVNGYDGLADLQLEFLGSGFAQNVDGVFTAGTVNVVAEFDLTAPALPMWIITGASVSATSIYAAALTPSPLDELAILEAVFSGNDTIVLSSFDDKASGGPGEDSLRGNGGNDRLDGGLGTDTAIFAGNREAYSISIAASGIVTVIGPDGSDNLTNIELLKFDNQTLAVNLINPPQPSSGSFRLFTSAGWSGVVGGNVSVTGTNGHERIAVVDQPGTTSLDGSFSRGNDLIVLGGSAAAWSVSRASASVARLSDGDTLVEVPVGGTGLAVAFDDGARLLRFDAGGTMLIGTQTIGNSLATIIAPASGASLPGGVDPSAAARMFITSASGAIAVGGRVQVVGTNDADRLHLLSGTISLDGSFTRGNDTLTLDHPASTYQAERIAGQLHLFGNGLDLVTPAGSGLLIDFPDSDQSLAFSGQSMILGAQVISTTAQFLFA